MNLSPDFILLIVGFLLSLFAFSLIFGDNWLFRLASAILSGTLAGYLVVVLIEKIFLPLVIQPLIAADATWKDQAVLALVILAALLLFLKHFFHKDSGGSLVLAILLCVATAITILGIVNGTFLNLYRGLILQALPESGQKDSALYWVETGILYLGFVSSLFYTQHFAFGQKKGVRSNNQGALRAFFNALGEIFIGITLGAIFAGCFIASATILINQLSNLLATGQTILQWVKP